MDRLPITCCYILKNEEAYLNQSLKSVVPWVSELILQDSGSTDQTPQIAESFRTQVPEFLKLTYSWQNDFSHARNSAAKLAKQPWILFVDGDEVLDESSYKLIQQAISSSQKIDCYSIIQRNYSLEAQMEEGQPSKTWPPGLPARTNQTLYYLDNWMERLYRADVGLTYEGRIHETLIPSCERLSLKHQRAPIVLHHYGRLKSTTPEKLRYYLKLTETKCAEDPNNPVVAVELGINLMELQEFSKAFVVAEKAVSQFKNEPLVYRMGFQAALRAEKYDVAEKWIRKFLSYHPEDLYAKSQLTTALLYQKKFSETLNTAQEIFKSEPQNFVAHLNCGVIFFEQENWTNAARHLKAAHQAKPSDHFVNEALKKIDAKLQKH